MTALVLLLALASTLVLHSGDKISVEGTPVEKDGVYTFRSEGKLFSLPASEVLRVESATPKVEAEAKPLVVEEEKKKPAKGRRPVSEEERKRLLAELEKNHNGTPAPPSQKLPALAPPPTREEVKEQKNEESYWRSKARSYDEAVRRANEELELLETRVSELELKINGFIAQGFKPNQFSYDTTLLHKTKEQIPYARLEVTRAVRASEQFREDARREGILPGWLR
ncbi:MAG TPA: hypothetical protein VGQ76_01905 [Thermoanaerobaculia bacterium]|jgi:hypothetical protein|nr:hypothetical protein [Thermoanaerobaculia bacterium]